MWTIWEVLLYMFLGMDFHTITMPPSVNLDYLVCKGNIKI